MNFLLEIGTEEIPHWMISDAVKQLEAMPLFGVIPQVDATPRRLVLRATGLPRITDVSEEWVDGPPKSAGIGAAQKFAEKMGVHVGQLEVRLRLKGEYYGCLKRSGGNSIRKLLAERLPSFILGLQWPKAMYWTGGKTGPRFIRPIRWLVALLEDEVIPIEIAGVNSGNITRGHRILGSSSIPVTFETYESALRSNGVILSFKERFEKIDEATKSLGAKRDPSLIDMLSNMTEWPAAIRGDFDQAFLDLPAEVLTTVMRVHQRYFSIVDEDGLLKPHFIAVVNTKGDSDGLIRKGNERVLKARFNDARFFWVVDQQKLLADRVQDLAHVTFLAKLGSDSSYLAKTRRIVSLIEELGGNEDTMRAGLLCKTDLGTEMVKEFTDLQGIIGGLYAKVQGEVAPVWNGIYEHYQPRSMDDAIPITESGRLVALADKLDTIRECFRIGLVPTGSKDPFALRRAAQGIVKILVEARMDYPLRHLLGENPGSGLYEFMLERVAYYFREVKGFKYDEVNAVLQAEGPPASLHHVNLRLQALAAVRPTENFEPLAASFKRIRNILKQANFEPTEVLDQHLLEDGPEKALHAGFVKVRDAARNSTYQQALEHIASLRPQVDTFFDKVLVNAKVERVRDNRLTLLHNLLTEFSTIADFSEIVTSGDQK